MTRETPLNFYNDLADGYHLLFENWDRAVVNQSKVWHDLFVSLRRQGMPPADETKVENDYVIPKDNAQGVSLLDCSCGIGTQAIGLAQRGYRVTATDLSPLSVERAKREAARLIGEESRIQFGVADFRSLEQDVTGTFDIVLSADNALPHLLTDTDLRFALSNMRAKLNQGGLLAISLRDYDELVSNKPQTTPLRVMDEGKRIAFQVWDWDSTDSEASDGEAYTLKQFTLKEINGSWDTTCHTVRYRALTRNELTSLLTEAGFTDIQWHMPEESGYYQPIVTARR